MTLFVISNEGYIPITDLGADCIPSFYGNSEHVTNIHSVNNRYSIAKFADYLGHGDKVTAPCFEFINNLQTYGEPVNVANGATLEIVVSYSFMHINVRYSRRSQRFTFRSVIAKDKSQHWLFVH
jgi:hypothetical protein